MTYHYTLTGKLHGRPVSITWNDGELSGDPEAVQALRDLAARREGTRVLYPEWVQTRHHHLASPVSTYVLAKEILGRFARITGTFPKSPKLPEGMEG